MPSRTEAERTPRAASPVVPAPGGRALGVGLVVGSLVGLLASVVLTVEKARLAADPDYVPSCSLNPVLSCGSVMASDQASLLGFPNSVLGLLGFPVVLLAGTVLATGGRLPARAWLVLQVGLLTGVAFVHWLAFQTLYRIGALCPYCLAVWAVTIPMAWYVTVHRWRAREAAGLPLPGAAAVAVRLHGLVLTTWFVAVAGLIAHRFWSYWSSLLP